MRARNTIVTMGMVASLSLASTASFAGPREQAYRIFNRLNGVPPTAEKWAELEALIKDGNVKGAALAAINDDGGGFYRILKDEVATWTNEDRYVRFPFNDYTATVLGMVRDDVPFNQVLSGDIIYVGVSPDSNNPLPPYTTNARVDFNGNMVDGNQHYEQIESRGLPIHKVLVRKKQSEMTTLPPDVAAGVLTSRQFAKAYYEGGTNRAAVRFTMMAFLCRDMEQLADTTRPDVRVGRDVSRAPGGDTATFKNRCAGCHTGMDGLRGAFAYMDYTADGDQGLVYNPKQPQTKMNRNSQEFPDGYVTTDDSWINFWATEGTNAALGWNGVNKGRGVKSWGQMVAASDAFSQCMAQRALTVVCESDLSQDKTKTAINQLANAFKTNNYSMKNLYASAALMCRGE